MADDPPKVQPKATTPEGIKIEAAARAVLSSIIGPSVSEKREYGGVIWRRDATGEIGYTGPIKGFSEAGVDVGQDKPNMGCPPGTTPVAWYHFHPTKETNVGGDRFKMDWDKFIEGDKLLSDGHNLPGYVASFDRQFWRYDPPPAVDIGGGKMVVTEGPGSYGVLLNGLIKPGGKPPPQPRTITMPPLR